MSQLASAVRALDAVLFSDGSSGVRGRARPWILLALFLVGLVHWTGFFHAGHLRLTAYDWAKESAYLDTLRQAIQTGTIPWCWSQGYYHGVVEFLSIPEVTLTPDVLLLPWVSNSAFVLVHVLLLYSVGFWGCVRLATKLQASTIAFFLFWLLFNVNGYITAHLAVGHLQWAGYFLLPAYFLLLVRLVTTSTAPTDGDRAALGMMLLLGLLLLNGSLHVAVWCCLFMAIAGLWRPRSLRRVAVAIAGGVILGAGRLLPAALYFGSSYHPFMSGYPSPTTLLAALTTLRGHDAVPDGGLWGTMGWWEYDVFIGVFALALLVVAAVFALRARGPRDHAPMLAAAGALLLFSLGDGYGLIAKAPIPFAGVERAPSRFVILPLITLLVIGLSGVDELLRRHPKHGRALVLLAMPFMAYELREHWRMWHVAGIEGVAPASWHPVLSIVPAAEPLYVASVYAGWAISLVALGVVAWWYVRDRKNRGRPRFAPGARRS